MPSTLLKFPEKQLCPFDNVGQYTESFNFLAEEIAVAVNIFDAYATEISLTVKSSSGESN